MTMADWTVVGVDGGGSRNPEREAQARKERAERRRQWDELQAALPVARARLEAVQGVHLPSLLGAEAQALAALEAAQGAFRAGVVRQQGGQAIGFEGRASVALDLGEEESDPAVMVAWVELKRIRQGLSRLREQEAALKHNIGLAVYASPPPPAD